MNSERRLQLVENTLIVMQREISQTLGETQMTVETLAKTLRIALETIHQRLTDLEKIYGQKAPTVTTTEVPDSGIEL